jgi:hypothetical protein
MDDIASGEQEKPVHLESDRRAFIIGASARAAG